MINIQDLYGKNCGKEVLKGFNLEIGKGEVHAIMGPNGVGKSTLTKALMGHEDIKITSGDILMNSRSIIDLDLAERSAEGIFVGFQNPIEIEGVNNRQFLQTIKNEKLKREGKDQVRSMDFMRNLLELSSLINLDDSFLKRDLNSGFSGGEKKRNEILQMMVLEPEFVILDEIDSGVDIDSLSDIARGVEKLRCDDRSFLLITHYKRLLNHIPPDYVHIMVDGKIVKSGGLEVAEELELKGYKYFKG